MWQLDWAAHVCEEYKTVRLAGTVLTQSLSNGGVGWITDRKQGIGRWNGCKIWLLW